MNDQEIMHYAAIITAGLIARDHESEISPKKAVDLFGDIVAAIKEKRDSSVQINAEYDI